MATFATKYTITFELSDMKWSDHKGQNSGFFIEKVKEITGYDKLSFGFPLVLTGDVPLTYEQMSELANYIKID
jgi:hypothetical protein